MLVGGAGERDGDAVDGATVDDLLGVFHLIQVVVRGRSHGSARPRDASFACPDKTAEVSGATGGA